jgi:hypothetical protein
MAEQPLHPAAQSGVGVAAEALEQRLEEGPHHRPGQQDDGREFGAAAHRLDAALGLDAGPVQLLHRFEGDVRGEAGRPVQVDPGRAHDDRPSGAAHSSSCPVWVADKSVRSDRKPTALGAPDSDARATGEPSRSHRRTVRSTPAVASR